MDVIVLQETLGIRIEVIEVTVAMDDPWASTTILRRVLIHYSRVAAMIPVSSGYNIYNVRKYLFSSPYVTIKKLGKANQQVSPVNTHSSGVSPADLCFQLREAHQQHYVVSSSVA